MADLICAAPITRGPNKGKTATGTSGGYMRHRKIGEPACQACLDYAARRNRAWKKANPEQAAKTKQHWYENSVEQRAAYQRAYREANAQRLAEYDRQRYLTQPERRTQHDPEKQRRYRLKNKAKVYERNRRRNARKAGVLRVPFTTEQLAAKMEYWGNRCWIRIHCDGVPYDSVDHVIPLARGGPHVLANLRPACRPCNAAKGARTDFISKSK